MKDLFGEEAVPFTLITGRYKRFRVHNNYRKKLIDAICCKECKHLNGFEYHGKNYYKCELQGMSHSEASDVRLSFVCDKFERRE